MVLNCPYCGLPLKRTTHGRYFCSNHGIVGEDRDIDNEESDENRRAEYIG